jgi:hypothetical protein
MVHVGVEIVEEALGKSATAHLEVFRHSVTLCDASVE